MAGDATITGVYEPGPGAKPEVDIDDNVKPVTTDDDGYAVGAFAAYDFGVTKVTLGAQYFDGVKQSRGTALGDGEISFTPEIGAINDGGAISFNGSKVTFDYGDESAGVKGYGVMLGAVTPIASGALYTSIGYRDSENADEDINGQADKTAYQVAIGYTYPLSKRTYLYTAAGYYQEEVDDGADEVKSKTTEVVAGIVHNF